MRKAGLSLLLLFLIAIFPRLALASPSSWETVGHRYGISPHLLYAIASVESRLDPNVVRRNQNGTYDIGLMQINSSWLPKLKRMGISMRDLFDPHVNLNVGAWILSENIKEYGATWKAVGAYNATSVKKQARYAKRVAEKLSMILANPKIFAPTFFPDKNKDANNKFFNVNRWAKDDTNG